MPERHELTDLQIAILRLLWAKGEASVADIWEAIHSERGLALTTVATILTRLQRRGVLGRRTVARQYLYFSLVSEEDVRHSMVGKLTEQLFDGDVAALVSHLLTARGLMPDDLARVRAMIEDAAGNSRSLVTPTSRATRA